MEIEPRHLEALPLFPLPNVVLFPGALLPLHVFEQRYVDLTLDALAGPALLAVPRLEPGYQDEYFGAPAINTTAGLGKIVDSRPLSGGRFNILVRGLCRVIIEVENPSGRTYRQGRARILDDRHSRQPDSLDDSYKNLVALCDQLALNTVRESSELRKLVRSRSSPGECADAVASAIITDPDTRQALLECLDPADRLEHLIGHVSTLLVKHKKTSGPPN